MLMVMLATMALSIGLTAIVRLVAWRWRIVDRPDTKRKFHKGRVPLWGGLAVYLAMVLGLLLALRHPQLASQPLRDLAAALIPAAGLACLFGALDDLWCFKSRRKLTLQFLSVLPLVAAGYSIDQIVVFGYPITLGWLGVPLTIVWLLGCINALNLIDGMDGLASMVGLSTAAMMGIIAVSMGNNHVAVIAIALAGALAGFLFYNFPPASIFLGDSGSTVIGLVVGILGIQGAMKTSATLSITTPAVIMTLPMFDVVMAVVRRKLTGRRFDAADAEHIHHVLLKRGLHPWQVLGIIAALCLTTGAAATAATVFRKDALAWITAVTLVVLMIRLRLFGYYEFTLLKGALARLAARVLGDRVGGPSLREENELLTQADDEDLVTAGNVVKVPARKDHRKAA
jgi:UDP-GlcNAc:undecaprenyl-phosphate GlcNAc-1-phosphate transferase